MTFKQKSHLFQKKNEFKILLDKKQKYLLVGNEASLKEVKSRLDHLVPCHCIFFWKKADVTVIKADTKYDEIKKSKENFHLMVCTFVTSDSTDEIFCLPSSLDKLPPNIKQRSIVIVQKGQETKDDVKNTLNKIQKNTQIQAFLPMHAFFVSDYFKLSEFFFNLFKVIPAIVFNAPAVRKYIIRYKEKNLIRKNK